jgi:hypothetical protein
MNNNTYDQLDPEGELPEVYYEPSRSRWWLEDRKGKFQPYNRRAAETVMKQRGFTKNKEVDEVSPILDCAVTEKCVDLVIAISGYAQGLHDINGIDILVPTEPDLIKPVEGEWETIKTILQGIQTKEQYEWLYWWLAVTVQGLYEGTWVPAPVPAFIGGVNSCKSLLQALITRILGNRVARVVQAITGGTAFNADWAAATHLVVEDDFSENSHKVRQRIKEQIKAVAVNGQHRIHPKGKDALIVSPFWRMTLSCNPEPDSLAVLPPLDNSVRDKFSALWFNPIEMPLDSSTPAARSKAWDVYMSELPGMVFELLNAGSVPDHLRGDGRSFICAYYDEQAADAVGRLSDDGQTLSSITECLDLPWEGTAHELYNLMVDHDINTYRSSKGVGRLLSRLSESHSSWVTKPLGVTQGVATYKIQQPDF